MDSIARRSFNELLWWQVPFVQQAATKKVHFTDISETWFFKASRLSVKSLLLSSQVSPVVSFADEAALVFERRDYWSTVEPEEWGMTQFDLELCKKGLITKAAAHEHLHSDAKILEGHSDPRVKKGGKRIATELKNAESNSGNVAFWKETAPSLARVYLDKIHAEEKFEVAAINRAAEVIGKRALGTELPEASSSKANKKQKIDVGSRIEYAGVYVRNMDSSVGTTIKTAAVKLHERFVRGKKALTPHERKIMSIGLSSILDTVDMSTQGQLSLWQQQLGCIDNLMEEICSYLSRYKVSIANLKINNYEIIGYVRKSPGNEEEDDPETRPKLLQKMVDNLYDRSLADKVYVSASSHASSSFNERDMKNLNILMICYQKDFKKVENGYYSKVTNSVWDFHPHHEEHEQ